MFGSLLRIWLLLRPLRRCGFTGDKELKKWAKDPLGRATRVVLWVLLHACEAFAVQLRDSGVHVAMDNYFSSSILSWAASQLISFLPSVCCEVIEQASAVLSPPGL